jgi:GDP-L-fucose synthase
MFRDSKIYVAGHTGLLGKALKKRLETDGYQDIVTQTHSELDLTNRIAVMEYFDKESPEYVFLAAGLTGGIVANKTYPADFLHVNIAIQDNIFEAAREYEIKHLIFYGSSCAYPKNSPQPIKEEYLLSGAIEVTSEAYAAAKIAGILACKAYNNQCKNNRFIALIPNSMFGPNDNFDLENSHVMAAIIRKLHEARANGTEKIILWGSGSPRREFIFSEDVADASIFIMNNAEKLDNSHYNLGTGVDYSIKELSKLISKIVGYNGEIIWDTSKPDGTPKKLLDSSKFLNMGWKPSTNIEDGIRLAYEWFIDNNTGIE